MTSIDENARIADADDIPLLEALAAEAIAELTPHRGGYLWSQLEARTYPLSESLSGDIADPSSIVVVGTIDGAGVGYGVATSVALHDGSAIARVTDIYVLPDGRGVGVGEAMIDAILDWAASQGHMGVDSLALPGDRATKNFFETHGMVARAIVVHRRLQDPQ